MSSKYFCDICGKEINEGGCDSNYQNLCLLFEAVLITDCCDDCLDILEQQVISAVIKSALREVCIPKSVDEEKERKEFLRWFARLSWVKQQELYSCLTHKLNPQSLKEDVVNE